MDKNLVFMISPHLIFLSLPFHRQPEGNQLPCRAQVSVSDIRIPLMWKDVDHFKNKGDYRKYAVFCLLKVGTEIYDTSMIIDVDRTMTDITFEDVILL